MVKILKFQENNILIYSLVSLIVLLGLIFRFYNIGYDNLWLDEIFSFWVSDPNLSFVETFSRVKSTEYIPFLHYYIIKICNSFFGYDPVVGRIFSAVFGFLSIFTLSSLCKRFVDNKSYLLVLCLVSLNIYLIIYSQEMRVYIFTFFLISLALIFFFNLYDEHNSKVFTKNFFFFSLFMLLAIFSHPFSIIILGSLVCFTFVDYIFFKVKNKKINISLTLIFIFTLLFLFHYLQYVSLITDAINWIQQPGLKFYTNFYFSKFFGSRLLGIIHLVTLIFLSFYLWKKIIYNKKIIFLYIMLFLSYFVPLIYGYFLKPIIFPRYIIFVLIPIILIISILIFYLENKNLRRFLIFFFVFINLGNHLTENTFKQFFYEKKRFKPNFDLALEIINSSETNNMVLYREKVDKNKPDYVGLVLFNYVKSIIENKEYEINLLNTNLEKYKGKVWNICFINTLNECYKTSMEIEVLNDKILQGGIKLSLWETKG